MLEGQQLQFASLSTEGRSEYTKPHSHDISAAIILLIFVTLVMSPSLNSNSAAFIATHKCVFMFCKRINLVTSLLASAEPWKRPLRSESRLASPQTVRIHN